MNPEVASFLQSLLPVLSVLAGVALGVAFSPRGMSA